jgi:hypothetical protein
MTALPNSDPGSSSASEPGGADFAADLQRCVDHAVAQVRAATVGKLPFYHTFVANLFPDDIYQEIRQHMLAAKYGEEVRERTQDNAAFKNRRFNMFARTDRISMLIKGVFSHDAVKEAIATHFYMYPTPEFRAALRIHNEFEYVFTPADRFQNIHVDIPPKFISLVFYIPEGELSEDDIQKNATILYDKTLTPQYRARYQANSVCIFVPHYYSYHGFASTIDRDALVMFYVNDAEFEAWRSVRAEGKDEPPFEGLLGAVASKLKRHPLIEYGEDDARIQAEREQCLVNAPQGRVMINKPDQAS